MKTIAVKPARRSAPAPSATPNPAPTAEASLFPQSVARAKKLLQGVRWPAQLRPPVPEA